MLNQHIIDKTEWIELKKKLLTSTTCTTGVVQLPVY